MLPDFFRHLVNFSSRYLDNGNITGDQQIDVVYVNKAITECARHIGINLCNDKTGALGPRLGNINADPVTAITMLIRCCYLDQRDVDRHLATSKKPRNLRQKNRCKVGPPLRDCIANIRTDKQGVMTKTIFQFWIGIRRDPESKNVGNLCVCQFLASV